MLHEQVVRSRAASLRFEGSIDGGPVEIASRSAATTSSTVHVANVAWLVSWPR
jgi:hypothetical protein